jgi:hypothetical protein
VLDQEAVVGEDVGLSLSEAGDQQARFRAQDRA